MVSSMPHDLDAGSTIRARTILSGLGKLGNEMALVSTSTQPHRGSPAWPFFDYSRYQSLSDSIDDAITEFRPDLLYSITVGHLDKVKRVAADRDLPLALDFHGFRSLEILSEGSTFREKIQSISQSISWERHILAVDLITVANPVLYRMLRTVSRKALPVIGIVDQAFFDISSDKPSAGAIGCMYAGNLHSYQGIELFLQAIERMPASETVAFEFCVFGTTWGDARQDARLRTLNERGLIRLENPVPFVQFPALLASFDICVVPRPWSVATYLAFPQKLIEALASGRCVVATDIAPHRFAIRNGIDGILCKANPRSLADAILQAKSHVLRKTISANARATAYTRYHEDSQCLKIHNALFRIL